MKKVSLCIASLLSSLFVHQAQSFKTENYIGFTLGYTNVQYTMVSNLNPIFPLNSEEIGELVTEYDKEAQMSTLPNTFEGIQPLNQINIFQDLTQWTSVLPTSEFLLAASVQREIRFDSGIALRGALSYSHILGPAIQHFVYPASSTSYVDILEHKTSSNQDTPSSLQEENKTPLSHVNYAGYAPGTNSMRIHGGWGLNVYGSIGVYSEDIACFINFGYALEHNKATLNYYPFVSYGSDLAEEDSPVANSLESSFFRNGLMVGVEFIFSVNRFADIVLNYNRTFYPNAVVSFSTSENNDSSSDPIVAQDFYTKFPNKIGSQDITNIEENYHIDYPEDFSMESYLERTYLMAGFRFKVGMQKDY